MHDARAPGERIRDDNRTRGGVDTSARSVRLFTCERSLGSEFKVRIAWQVVFSGVPGSSILNNEGADTPPFL